MRVWKYSEKKESPTTATFAYGNIFAVSLKRFIKYIGRFLTMDALLINMNV